MAADPQYLDIDATLCRAMTECGTKAAVRHVLGYTTADERSELLVGAAVHEAIAAYLQGVEPRVVLPALAVALEPVAAMVPSDDRRQPANVLAIMRRWFAVNTRDKLPVTVAPEMVEVGFQVAIGRSPKGKIIRYCGRCDAIGEDRAGDWWIVEHKTTSRISSYWVDRWKLDGQVTGYVMAAAQLTERRVIGCMIDGIGITKLPSSNKKCREHGVAYVECGPTMHTEFRWLPVARTARQLEAWMRTVYAIAAEYEALQERVRKPEDLLLVDMNGTYNNSCQWCQLNNFCLVGRPTANIEAMLVYEPWKPYERAGLRG